MKAGAGGSWKRFDEKFDSDILKQTTGISCVSALGEMLLRERGIICSQENIRQAIGEPADIASLANELSKFDKNGKWYGIFALPEEIDIILKQKLLGVILQEPKSLGHAVFIKKVTQTYILIFDPYDQTSYKMTKQNFNNAWGGGVIYYAEN
jgi:ABC-type bacteriocin/lantibiotic exporter with double-glycine peptidase domain